MNGVDRGSRGRAVLLGVPILFAPVATLVLRFCVPRGSAK